MLDLRIQQHFIDSADLQYQAAEPLVKPVEAGVHALLASLFVGGFERERPELAALALTAEGGPWAALPDDQVLARQVRALGHMGDVLMVLTSTGDEPMLQQAVRSAHERDMTVIALTGKGGGALAKLLRETDVHVCVPHDRAARIREVQQLVLHCLCDGVDAQLLGEQELSE
jgi:D-sedoheptulose 7-phosphate isomerase